MTVSSSDRYIDPSTNAKKAFVSSGLKLHDGKPIFSMIEFNIYQNCNRNCSFCPVSNPEVYTRKKEGITVELFTKAMNDLKAINYEGTILFSAFSEPTLHTELVELIKITKRVLPNIRLEMVTNGDSTRRNHKKLMSYFDAGMDKISFSLYDGPEQMEEFKSIRKKLNLSEDMMVLRRRYLQDGNFGMTISNRAGLIDSNEYRDNEETAITELPLKTPCFYPSYMLLIDSNGDVILCPHDWEKSYGLANIQEKSIWEIWTNKQYVNARKMLTNNNRNFSPCDKCDVKGDVMGKESFEAWNAIL
jgi:radical SAM protein with 4Fe4S-binding SPASM domain